MLKLDVKKPRKFISPLLSKKSITTNELTQFQEATLHYLDELEKQRIANQSEPNIVSNVLQPFFKQLGYVANSYSQKGQSGIDLALMHDHSPTVIIEAKAVDSSAMISKHDINKKALHEAILYFMRERAKGNDRLYHIIITDFYRWFVFDAKDFDRFFWKNGEIKKVFESVKDPSVLGDRTEDFYKLIASKIVEMKSNLIDDQMIECAYFDLKDKRSEKEAMALYKLLSKDTLLKAFNPNDANTLNRAFYSELLYILGLEEQSSGGKKLISRAKKPLSGSLYENITQKLIQYGKPTDFESVIRLMIIWINRILFLKLLESQLIKWNDKPEYAFLNTKKIKDFDKLEILFFDILAKKPHERGHKEFDYIPYLNSSLFEVHAFENETLKISNLEDDRFMSYYSKTVLKDNHGQKKNANVNMLHYLFEFLDAYDFSSEGSEELVTESKSLINASVLGLIFEKLNGYKDGSFYTPSFVTMYMSKETIEKAAIEKFNQAKGWNCKTLNDLDDKIEDKKEANEIIDSLTVCDPAVGSGHFLVSVLNTILRIKSELRILFDEEGRRIKDYEFSVENDELIVKDDEGEIFEYKRGSREKTRIQKLLFTQKQKIIENSLFGVDINPNSANITRLRLWIELLKHSYYEEGGQLITMPNIDINIKVGNSLISRYGLDDEIDIPNIKHAIECYKASVTEYKEGSFLSKEDIRSAIEEVKGMFGLTLQAQWSQTEEYKKQLGKYVKIYSMDGLTRNMQLDALDFNFGYHGSLFGEELNATKKKEKAKLLEKVIKSAKEIEEIEKGKIYEDAFEWRFEFPEVLDEEGNFVGFDVVIGNPPYGVKFNQRSKKYYENIYLATDDIYTLFIERGLSITSNKGLVDLITPIFWLTGDNYLKTRKMLLEKYHFTRGIVLPYDVFEDAYIDTGIFAFQKTEDELIKNYEFNAKNVVNINILDQISFNIIRKVDWLESEGYKLIFNPFARKLTKKLNKHELTIGDITQSTRGILAQDSYYCDSSNSNEELKVFTGKLNRYERSNEYKYIRNLNDIKEKPSDFQIFTNERILIRRIISRQFRIMASVTNESFINKKDIYIFKSTDKGFANKYLLAIINSKFISYFKTNISTSAKKDDFSQLTLSDIRKLPIPNIDEESQQPFITLVDQIITLKKQNQDTSELEAQIDQMVYELYGLSEDEVALIEGEK